MSDKHLMGLQASGSSQSAYMKSAKDQKHGMVPNSSKMQRPPPYTMDVGKNMKQNHNDYHNPQSNPMAQMIQQASLQKKPPWQQQQQTLPPLQIPPVQVISLDFKTLRKLYFFALFCRKIFKSLLRQIVSHNHHNNNQLIVLQISITIIFLSNKL